MEHRQPYRAHKWLDWRSVKFQVATGGPSGSYQPSSYSNAGASQQTGGQTMNTTGTATTTQSSNANQQGSQTNTYLPWQQQLQGQVGQAQENMLSGNVPTSFTNPQATTQAYMDNFNQYVAPELAAQYGAGSPAIGATLSSGLTNLAATNYEQGISNYGNAINSAAGTALTPTGQTSAGTQATQGTGTTTSTQEMTDLINMLDQTSASGAGTSGFGLLNLAPQVGW
jgi:hypothetical protein